jgi:hypothetical protein
MSVYSLAARARYAEWIDADACAFLLSLKNRRAFLERVAVIGSFPKPAQIGGQKRWKRADVLRWADDQARINAKRAA